jgi:hypothetical protein
MEFIQFPWRFVIVSIFAASFLSAYLVDNIPKKIGLVSGIVISIITIILYGSYFKPKDCFLISDNQKLTGFELKRQLTASIYDYLPKSAKKAPDDTPSVNYINISGTNTGRSFNKGSDWYRMVIDSESEVSEVALTSYSFPAWNVYVNGKLVTTKTYGDYGLVSFKLDKGSNVVSANLGNSPIRSLGNVITLIALIIIPTIYLYEAKIKKVK